MTNNIRKLTVNNSFIERQNRKRLFIGLLSISLVLLLSLFLFLWWVFISRGFLINRLIVGMIISGIVSLFLLLIAGLCTLVLSLWYSKNIVSLQSLMQTATTILFPLAINIGKMLGMSEESIKNSFIQVSNHLVKTRKYEKPIKRVMILAPHCLQWIHCPHKITINVNNCKRCGKCTIGELISLSEKRDIDLRVVTGGTLARQAIKDTRPGAIVAIACERDLTSGIQDISGIPVIGVINDRPEGPCCNTCVNLQKVEEAVQFFQKGGE